MKMFDKKFVHFMWDDELKGKECFLEDNIDDLRYAVEINHSDLHREVHFGESNSPFDDGISRWRFAYYDPNYEVKRAYYKEGKKVQFKKRDCFADWVDTDEPEWLVLYEYRVKPEQERFIVYLARPKYGDCHLTACAEGMWGVVQKEFEAKTKLFVGTCDEAVKWYEPREKFTEIIKAWEDGKEIQCRRHIINNDWVNTSNPTWEVGLEYRVKPECPCEEGIDSKACAGCEHSEDGKQHRPYRDVVEFIADYAKRFPTATPRPAGTMPLIWIAHKTDGTTRLIVEFFDRGVKIGCKVKPVDFGKLFEYWTYLDESPVGKEC